MKNIRLFDTETDYNDEKESIPTPSVTLVEEPRQVIYDPLKSEPNLVGKFADDSTEPNWYWYPNYDSTSSSPGISDRVVISVDPITKEFSKEYPTSMTRCEFTFSQTLLERLDKFPDTSSVTRMLGMFNRCASLTSVNLDSFNTSNVIDMNGMFFGCSNLTTLDLSNFDTSNVTSMNAMFSGCSKLENLNLRNFDASKLTDMSKLSQMFYECDSLTHITCKQAFKDWCWTNQDILELPTQMRDSGSGTWTIVD